MLQDSMDVAPGEERSVPVVRMEYGIGHHAARLCYSNPAMVGRLPTEAAFARTLIIVAVGEDVPKCVRRFVLDSEYRGGLWPTLRFYEAGGGNASS